MRNNMDIGSTTRRFWREAKFALLDALRLEHEGANRRVFGRVSSARQQERGGMSTNSGGRSAQCVEEGLPAFFAVADGILR